MLSLFTFRYSDLDLRILIKLTCSILDVCKKIMYSHTINGNEFFLFNSIPRNDLGLIRTKVNFKSSNLVLQFVLNICVLHKGDLINVMDRVNEAHGAPLLQLCLNK